MTSFAVKLKRGFFLRLLEASALGGFCLLVLGDSYPAGAANAALAVDRYITIDEVQPGMDAYCLTGYKGAEIEKFPLEVLSVVRDIRPGRDAILVQGTDERFIHTGPVWGCSGSPVYIDGRLAGALAFTWSFSKDPLYGVTPIEDILKVGQETQNSKLKTQNYGMGFVFDFSKPVDFAEIDGRITAGPGTDPGLASKGHPDLSGVPAAARRFAETSPPRQIALPCPLITYGLPTEVCEQLGALVEPFGLYAVSLTGVTVGGSGGGSVPGAQGGTGARETEHAKLAPGACLAVPLVTGDIKIEVIGTVTEVRSFKLASSVKIVGALTVDESTGVLGQLGRKAKMIPLTIRVTRYNDTEPRVYNCQIANNRLLTPLVLRSVVAGAALLRGNLPPENTVAYKGLIDVAGFGPISFENVSSGFGLAEAIADSVGPVAMLMNNPYEVAEIRSLDFDISIMSKSAVAHIWSVDLSDSRVKAGQTIEITVVVESVLGGRKKYESSLRIPDELVPGQYDLIISGGRGYGEFLKKAVPYRFVPQSLPGLVEAMNNVLSVKRDKLYCLLVLPAGGIAIEKAELPDLPATKALILQDGKRTLSTQSYPHWLEQTVETGTVVIDKKVMRITVEE